MPVCLPIVSRTLFINSVITVLWTQRRSVYDLGLSELRWDASSKMKWQIQAT